MANDGTLAVGETVGGKYVVESFVGSGGMGVVYAAKHATLGRPVAIKWMLPSRAHDSASVRRFLREARALGGINHPNVVDVLDCGVHDGSPFLVIELLAGSSLRAHMTAGTPMDPSLAIALVVQAMEGVQAAHSAGILHRDLKPENLFVVREGRSVPLTKVLDLGLAKLLHDESVRFSGAALTGMGHVLGTPAYMSPEQVLGTDDSDVRTDVWALGVILYELIAGRRPHQSTQFNRLLFEIASEPHDPLASIVSDLPCAVTDAVETALSKDKADRFADVRTFAGAISRFAMPSKNIAAALPAPVADRHQGTTRAAPKTRVGSRDETADDGERMRHAPTDAQARDDALPPTAHGSVGATWAAPSPPGLGASVTIDDDARASSPPTVERASSLPTVEREIAIHVSVASLSSAAEHVASSPDSVAGGAPEPTAPSPAIAARDADSAAPRRRADLAETTSAAQRPGARSASRLAVVVAWIAVVVAVVVFATLLVWTVGHRSAPRSPPRIGAAAASRARQVASPELPRSFARHS